MSYTILPADESMSGPHVRFDSTPRSPKVGLVRNNITGEVEMTFQSTYTHGMPLDQARWVLGAMKTMLDHAVKISFLSTFDEEFTR